MHMDLHSLIGWLRQAAAASHGLLVPVSGGSDSALCFWLCTEAFPERTLGVHAGAELRCRSWFEARGRVDTIPPPEGRTGREREVHRWATMLDLGLTQLRWLVGSRNRTEEVFGTYSLASRLATLLPLAGVWKSEVMRLCQHAGVPAEIATSSRRADPECGRSAEMSEVPLELIDLFLQVKTGELTIDSLSTFTPGQLDYLEGIYQYNQFKKALPLRGPRAEVGGRAGERGTDGASAGVPSPHAETTSG
jgi:NH3-dependent NAD+ synthetase